MSDRSSGKSEHDGCIGSEGAENNTRARSRCGAGGSCGAELHSRDNHAASGARERSDTRVKDMRASAAYSVDLLQVQPADVWQPVYRVPFLSVQLDHSFRG